ncbi:MAG: hypothetical protein BGN97_04945 [Microbacterium sp. 69-10]|uniref:hypothetical protein n=1 Tax=Microbacterium sp. 69-10 TaxID=1895783 RepID=UPI00095B4E4F|nr:hypothetical protein [Microbacterium sp. 69-10]OJU42092.1 MAG: hypothetical protein BGN97_04945 [Microbacterium sp. 69-10]
MKRMALGATVALVFVLIGAGTAYAGEVTCNGKDAQGANHASSECAFSGQDTWDQVENNPAGFDDDALAMRGSQKHGYHGVRNFGTFMRNPDVKASMGGFNPGDACRGNMTESPEP